LILRDTFIIKSFIIIIVVVVGQQIRYRLIEEQQTKKEIMNANTREREREREAME